MSRLMGIIKLDSPAEDLKELCQPRPVAALPFAGRYRVVDFALSNMVTSGVDRVGVLLCEKAGSVFDHIRSGKDWDLARHREGLAYLPTDPYDGHVANGNLPGMYQNLNYVKKSGADYVVVTNADVVFNMDYTPVAQALEESGADIMMVYRTLAEDLKGATVTVKVSAGRVTDIAKQKDAAAGEKDFIGVYVMPVAVYAKIVAGAFERGGTDFLMDGIIRDMGEYAVAGYEFTGYVAKINSAVAYFNANKDVLKPEVWTELFMSGATIHTKTKDAVPVQYKEGCKVTNSLIANGCEIYGEVENCILFRDVKIAAGAKVKDSVIMEGCVIEANGMVRDVILDKDVKVTADQWIKGTPAYPMIVSKHTVI